MSWFNTEGNCPQFFILSQAKYLRSPAGLPFKATDSEDYQRLLAETDTLMAQNGFRKEVLPPGESADTLSLAEKQFLDGSEVESHAIRTLYLNEPCNLSVTVGGKSFFTVRSILSGKAVSESLNVAAGAEEMLDTAFEMAYSEERGYLSPDPDQCGSGASISVTLYLPSLSVSSASERLRAECARHGVEIVPFSLHGGNPGDLYRITCYLSRNASEKQAAASFEAFCDKIVQNESRLLHSACDQRLDRIIDHGRRAYGLLTYASEISEAELLTLLSRLRLGLILAPDAVALPHVSFTTLNSLLAEGLNGSVIASSPAPCTSETDCRKLRAKLTSKILRSSESGQQGLCP